MHWHSCASLLVWSKWSCTGSCCSSSARSPAAAIYHRKTWAARVFEEPITAEQVRRYVHNLPDDSEGALEQTGIGPREFLQPLIDRKLLVHEARARNLEDDLDYLRWHRQTVHNPAIRQVVGGQCEAGAGNWRRGVASLLREHSVRQGSAVGRTPLRCTKRGAKLPGGVVQKRIQVGGLYRRK